MARVQGLEELAQLVGVELAARIDVERVEDGGDDLIVPLTLVGRGGEQRADARLLLALERGRAHPHEQHRRGHEEEGKEDHHRDAERHEPLVRAVGDANQEDAHGLADVERGQGEAADEVDVRGELGVVARKEQVHDHGLGDGNEREQ